MKKILFATLLMLACASCFAGMRGFGNSDEKRNGSQCGGYHSGVLAPSIENIVGAPIYAADDVLTTPIIDTRPVSWSNDNPYHDYGFASDGFDAPCAGKKDKDPNDRPYSGPAPVSSHIMR